MDLTSNDGNFGINVYLNLFTHWEGLHSVREFSLTLSYLKLGLVFSWFLICEGNFSCHKSIKSSVVNANSMKFTLHGSSIVRWYMVVQSITYIKNFTNCAAIKLETRRFCSDFSFHKTKNSLHIFYRFLRTIAEQIHASVRKKENYGNTSWCQGQKESGRVKQSNWLR